MLLNRTRPTTTMRQKKKKNDIPKDVKISDRTRFSEKCQVKSSNYKTQNANRLRRRKRVRDLVTRIRQINFY